MQQLTLINELHSVLGTESEQSVLYSEYQSPETMDMRTVLDNINELFFVWNIPKYSQKNHYALQR